MTEASACQPPGHSFTPPWPLSQYLHGFISFIMDSLWCARYNPIDEICKNPFKSLALVPCKGAGLW